MPIQYSMADRSIQHQYHLAKHKCRIAKNNITALREGGRGRVSGREGGRESEGVSEGGRAGEERE